MEKFKVTFYPDNKTVEVPKDTSLLSAAVSAGIYINSTCGGDGVCGKCKVIVKKGSVFTQPTGMITHEERKGNVYLACLTLVQGDLEIEVPPETRLGLEGLTPEEIHRRIKGFYSESEEVESVLPSPIDGAFSHCPLVKKVYLELPKAQLEDPLADLERIQRQLKQREDLLPLQEIMPTGLVNIRQLSDLLRASDWKITVALANREGSTEIMLIEPGNTKDKNFAFCFDIGTTTITGQLVDLNTKQVLGTKATYNKQISFGSDVITRIIHAQEEQGLEQLHLAVIDCLDQIIAELVSEHKINLNDVTCIVCAGNTTMIHLLLSIDPTHIRKEPYIPTANFLPTIRAAEIGVRINPRGILATVPGVASYVGADVTAGVLSCGLDKEDDLCVLIDVGTNGEIVVGNKEFLISCAASAGPAFEGSGVVSGMRATKGAIQKVSIDPISFEIKYAAIGNAKPKGICGSGYIDIISEMLKISLMDKSGKITMSGNKNVRNGDYGREFVIVPASLTDTGSDIVITEADIDNLKRAKAAIYSACSTLLKHVNLDFAAVKKFFIAGGFGTSIDIEKSIAIGLLPDLERERFIFVGNSSLSGTRQILLSSQAYQKAGDIARKMHYFELSIDTKYMEEYMAALFFPHTDLTLFPSFKNRKP